MLFLAATAALEINLPTVPTYDNLRTSVSGQSPAQFQGGGFGPGGGAQAPSGPTPGAIAADQAGAFGRAATSAGDAAGKIALDMAQQVNETRVIDAVNKAKERMFDLTYNKDSGFSMQKGINALERPDGADLATEYTQRFQKDLDDIGGTLGNDAQKQAFAQQAGRMRTELYGSAERHMSQEFTTYQGSVYEGATINAQRQIALNYADVAKGGAVEQGVATIEAATRAKARLAGVSAEFADTQVRKAVSNAHVLAIATALEKNDVAFADGYLKKFGKQMDADDILKMQGHVTKEMDLRQAEGVAAKAVAAITPQIFSTDGDRVVAITMNTESGGRRYGPDGKTLLTSSAGAKGEMQVLDGTNKNPGFGVKPAKDDTPEERARVGRDYIKAMVTRYDGDLAKAWAAYNAGPGALDDALTRAKGRAGADWLTFMPAETQAYVKKNVAAYTAGDGRPATPTLLDVHAQVREQLGPNAKPQVLQAALTRSTQQFEDLTKAKTAQETENVANAMRALVQNGGKYSDLPASVRAALPPKEIDNVMNFGTRIAKGDDTTNSALYLKLATDPAVLTSMSDNDFFKLRGQLNEADFKHFSQERATRKSGGGGNGFGDLNTQAINETVADRLRQLKIDPTPKDGSDDAVQVGTVHRFVRSEIAEAQRLAGKKFTDAETAKFVDKLFATNVRFKNTILGMGTSSSSQPLLSMKPGDIPSEVKTSLKKDFAARGNLSPSDADYLGAYMQLQKRRAGTTGTF
jgi:hypothetical protein